MSTFWFVTMVIGLFGSFISGCAVLEGAQSSRHEDFWTVVGMLVGGPVMWILVIIGLVVTQLGLDKK